MRERHGWADELIRPIMPACLECSGSANLAAIVRLVGVAGMLSRLVAVLVMISVCAPGPAASEDCRGRKGVLGVERTVEIDATGGPMFGDITTAAKEVSFLRPREVVLTFDDGPMPRITNSILETLERYCTKATFFYVGRMAIAYPETTRSILHRGHTLGTHTWSHPLNIARLRPEQSVMEIERGFAAVALAAGRPIAPFFRFPGLSDSGFLLDHLQKRGIASFTVDVVSNDSYISDWRRLAQTTLQRIEQRQGGIVLFHDIKAATAKALPVILEELVERGYKVVHLKPVRPVEPIASYDAENGAMLAKVEIAAGAKPPLVPFFGVVSTMNDETLGAPTTTRVTAEARPRLASPTQPAAKASRAMLRTNTTSDEANIPRRQRRMSEWVTETR
jgi:peptidoglycan/xylan/chitin deacetylase (PgdA/CDA1 family)